MWKYNQTMMKQLYKTIVAQSARTFFMGGLVATAMFSSCTADEEILDESNLGKVEFSLEGNATTRATTTTLSKEEAGEFWITIFKGSDVSKVKTQLKNLDTKLSAGYGYTATAENCDELTALSANDGWGQRRFYGVSDLFGIKIGEVTKVGIPCSVANTGVEVVFDESVPQYFTTSYKVTVTDGNRSLVFDSATGGSRVSNVVTNGKTGYFNISDDGTCTINYTIEAYSNNLRLVKTRSLTLRKATISRLLLTFIPGMYDLDVNIHNEDIYIEKDIEITNKDVTQDDGSTEMDSNHDGFEESDDNVDINDYN